MKTRFWNVLVETYEDGTVKAAVLRNRETEYQPPVKLPEGTGAGSIQPLV
jgi:hypothetical protein